jgi:hypothetical protein
MEEELYEIYILSYNNPRRQNEMQERFDKLGVKCNFYGGVTFADPRIAGRPNNDKRLWSATYGHLDMLDLFYNNSTAKYGIFCEDDIYVHKDFKMLMPKVVNDFENLKLDTLGLGYLTRFKIEPWYGGMWEQKTQPGFVKQMEGYHYHTYDDGHWGAQMYMLSRPMIKHILETYTGDYADRTLTDARLQTFSPDWILTKQDKNTRALISPPLAIEDGKTDLAYHRGDWGQYEFHMESHKIFYDPNIFI